METKRCPKCGETKPREEFERNGNGCYCKACHAEMCREYRTRKRGGSPPKNTKYTEEQKAEWRRYVAEHGNITDAALHFGVAVENIRRAAGDILRENKAKQNEIITKMRQEGKSYPQIAEALNVPVSLVECRCRKLGLGGKRGSRKPDYSKLPHRTPDEEKAKAAINAVGFDYVGGYTGCDGKAEVRCRACGETFAAPFQPIRKHGRLTCPVCKERQKAKEEKTRRIERETEIIERMMAAVRKNIEAAKKKAEDEDKRLHCCPICGKPVFRSLCCSDECRRTYSNRTHEQNRRAKMKNALVDRDIQLAELFRRDGGVCYLCGGKCDFSDCTITEDGHFIVGDSYPSIDHVMPLAAGGEHSWTNVRLAHHRCNTLKSDSIISPLS